MIFNLEIEGLRNAVPRAINEQTLLKFLGTC